MSAEVVGAVMAVLSEWSSRDGWLFVEPDERADFDGEIATALKRWSGERIRALIAAHLEPWWRCPHPVTPRLTGDYHHCPQCDADQERAAAFIVTAIEQAPAGGAV